MTRKEMEARGFTKDEIERHLLTLDVNNEVESKDMESEVARLKKVWGENNVWDYKAVGEHFKLLGFAAPFASAIRIKDNQYGTLTFQHSPRVYFNFKPGDRPSW